jgi:hypothetical protein
VLTGTPDGPWLPRLGAVFAFVGTDDRRGAAFSSTLFGAASNIRHGHQVLRLFGNQQYDHRGIVQSSA